MSEPVEEGQNDTDPPRCVCTAYEGERAPDGPASWCGRKLYSYEWYFLDASHAAQHLKNGGRIPMCENCKKALIAVFSLE